MRTGSGRSALLLGMVCCMTGLGVGAPRVEAQQANEKDRFEIRGTVVNEVTGQPVSGALVQVFGERRQVMFTDGDGLFAFADIPRGSFQVTAKKPGFVSGQQESFSDVGSVTRTMTPPKGVIVPQTGELRVKLVPLGLVYGLTKDRSGEPIEGVQVTARRWEVENGRRELAVFSRGDSDDRGEYRLSNLRPGTYILEFRPGERQGDEGFRSQFYPGTPDLASAESVAVKAGAQLHIDQAFAKQRVFTISGEVRGVPEGSGIGITVSRPAEEPFEAVARIRGTNRFEIPGVPPGEHVITATTFSMNGRADALELMATAMVTVNGDVTGLVLTLGRGASAAVEVSDERSASGGTSDPARVTVNLASREFPQKGRNMVAPPFPGDKRAPKQLEGLQPGRYEVEIMPHGTGYVASARCGSVNLLREELVVGMGAALPTIEITLRNDGAQISAAAVKKGVRVAASIAVISREEPARSRVFRVEAEGVTSVSNFAPGSYEVFAVDAGEEVEYRNPKAMEKFLGRAKRITLLPNDNMQIEVEMQDTQEKP